MDRIHKEESTEIKIPVNPYWNRYVTASLAAKLGEKYSKESFVDSDLIFRIYGDIVVEGAGTYTRRLLDGSKFAGRRSRATGMQILTAIEGWYVHGI